MPFTAAKSKLFKRRTSNRVCISGWCPHTGHRACLLTAAGQPCHCHIMPRFCQHSSSTRQAAGQACMRHPPLACHQHRHTHMHQHLSICTQGYMQKGPLCGLPCTPHLICLSVCLSVTTAIVDQTRRQLQRGVCVNPSVVHCALLITVLEINRLKPGNTQHTNHSCTHNQWNGPGSQPPGYFGSGLDTQHHGSQDCQQPQYTNTPRCRVTLTTGCCSYKKMHSRPSLPSMVQSLESMRSANRASLCLTQHSPRGCSWLQPQPSLHPALSTHTRAPAGCC